MAHLATASLTVAGWTDWIEARGSKLVDVSISGINGHTVTIQRDYTNTATGDTDGFIVEQHTTDAERVLQSGAFKYFRAGIVTGDFGTGTVDLRVEAGNAY